MKTNWYLTQEGDVKILLNADREPVAWYHAELAKSALAEKIKRLGYERNVEVVEL